MGIFSTALTMQDRDEEAANQFLKEMEIDVLARTLYGEARSEGQKGMEAVAHVVLNRVKHASSKGGQFWWGHDIITVCQMPYQFSCWNPGDPNRTKLMAVDEADIHFATCMRIARRAVIGQLGNDPTFGADHYHTVSVTPKWSQDEVPIAQIGAHVFFRLEY
jgi:spore germination cell wall hydrolase CwlJ-like protein